MAEISIYDLLNKKTIEDLTVDQLNTATSRTAIDIHSREFWSGILHLKHVLGASRTYSHGLSIPEAGAVWTTAVADSATGTAQPSNATELWRIEGVDIDSCAMAMTDGNEFVTVDPDKNPPPYFISKTMYIVFNNGSGSEKNPKLAYSKVSL